MKMPKKPIEYPLGEDGYTVVFVPPNAPVPSEGASMPIPRVMLYDSEWDLKVEGKGMRSSLASILAHDAQPLVAIATACRFWGRGVLAGMREGEKWGRICGETDVRHQLLDALGLTMRHIPMEGPVIALKD